MVTLNAMVAVLKKAMANANRSMDEKLKNGREYTYSKLGRLIEKLEGLL